MLSRVAGWLEARPAHATHASARKHSNRAPASLRTPHLRFMIAVHCGAGYHSQALEAAYKRGESGRLPWLLHLGRVPAYRETIAVPLTTPPGPCRPRSGLPGGRGRVGGRRRCPGCRHCRHQSARGKCADAGRLQPGLQRRRVARRDQATSRVATPPARLNPRAAPLPRTCLPHLPPSARLLRSLATYHHAALSAG